MVSTNSVVRSIGKAFDSMIIPAMLQAGDRVAAVSLSWGGACAVPERYEIGKRQIQEEFGLSVVEMPNTKAPAEWIAKHPEARAADLMQAFEDPSVRGIVSVIGGSDSIRILPYLNLEVIRRNPKPFIGYSDSTVTHLACYAAGVCSYYGPSVLSGFAENGGMHRYLAESFRRVVMSAEPPGILKENREGWTVEFIPWEDPEKQSVRRTLRPSDGWQWLQGRGRAEGQLFGGCLEVLDWLRGSPVWPDRERFPDTVLFLETSEEAPSPEAVQRMVRALFAAMPVDRVQGVLFGRPGGPLDPVRFTEYYRVLQQVVGEELGKTDLPIVCGMDFGHTDPFMTIPYGVRAHIDCVAREIAIKDAAVSKR